MNFTESILDVLGAHYRRAREVELTDIFTANAYGILLKPTVHAPHR